MLIFWIYLRPPELEFQHLLGDYEGPGPTRDIGNSNTHFQRVILVRSCIIFYCQLLWLSVESWLTSCKQQEEPHWSSHWTLPSFKVTLFYCIVGRRALLVTWLNGSKTASWKTLLMHLGFRFVWYKLKFLLLLVSLRLVFLSLAPGPRWETSVLQTLWPWPPFLNFIYANGLDLACFQAG